MENQEIIDQYMENRQNYMMDNNSMQHMNMNVASAGCDAVVGGVVQAEVVSGGGVVAGEILGVKYDEHHEEHDVGDDDEWKYVKEVQQSEKQQQQQQTLKNFGLDDNDDDDDGGIGTYETNELAEKETNNAAHDFGNGDDGFVFGGDHRHHQQQQQHHDLFNMGNGHGTNGHDNHGNVNINDDFVNLQTTGYEEKHSDTDMMEAFKNEVDFSSGSNVTESVEGFVPQVDVKIETNRPAEQQEMVDEEEPSSLATNTTNGTSSLSENVPAQGVTATSENTFDDFMANLAKKESADPITPQRPNELDLEQAHSQLNPDAKEFIPSFGSNPASPTSPFATGLQSNEPELSDAMETQMYFGQAPSAVPRHLLVDDDLVAQSPRKGKGDTDDMDTVSLPKELSEFEKEADKRPHELEPDDVDVRQLRDEVMTPDQAIQQLPLDDIDQDKENQVPIVSTDYQPSNFMDDGPETCVDLDADLELQSSAALATLQAEDDVMKRSMYVANDDIIEDVLNSVQPIPTEIDSVNNSFIEESATESATNQLAGDKELLQVEEKEHVSHSPSTEEIQMNLQNTLNSSNKDIPQLPIDMDNANNMQESMYMEQEPQQDQHVHDEQQKEQQLLEEQQHEKKIDNEKQDFHIHEDLQDLHEQQHLVEQQSLFTEDLQTEKILEKEHQHFTEDLQPEKQTELLDFQEEKQAEPEQQHFHDDFQQEKQPEQEQQLLHEDLLQKKQPEEIEILHEEEQQLQQEIQYKVQQEEIKILHEEEQQLQQEHEEQLLQEKQFEELYQEQQVEKELNQEQQFDDEFNYDQAQIYNQEQVDVTQTDESLLFDTTNSLIANESFLNNTLGSHEQQQEIQESFSPFKITGELNAPPAFDSLNFDASENQQALSDVITPSSTTDEKHLIEETKEQQQLFSMSAFEQQLNEMTLNSNGHPSQVEELAATMATTTIEDISDNVISSEEAVVHHHDKQEPLQQLQEQPQEKMFVDDSFEQHERECALPLQQNERDMILDQKQEAEPIHGFFESPIEQQYHQLESEIVPVEEPIIEVKETAAPLFTTEETEIVNVIKQEEDIKEKQELPPCMVPETAPAEFLESSMVINNETEIIKNEEEDEEQKKEIIEMTADVIKEPVVEGEVKAKEEEIIKPQVVETPEVTNEAVAIAATAAVAATATAVAKIATSSTPSKKTETAKKPLTKTSTTTTTKPKVGTPPAAGKKPAEAAKKPIGLAAKPRTATTKPAGTITDRPIAKATTTTTTARKPLSAAATKPPAKTSATTLTARTATTTSKTATTTRPTTAPRTMSSTTNAARRPATLSSTANGPLAKPRPATAPAKPTTLGLSATNGAPKTKQASPRSTLTSQLRKTATPSAGGTTSSVKSPAKSIATNGVAKTATSSLASRTKTTTSTVSTTAGTTGKSFTARPAPKFTSSSSTTTTTTTSKRTTLGGSTTASTTTTTTKLSSTPLRKSSPTKPLAGKTPTKSVAGLKSKSPITKESPPSKPAPIRKPVSKTVAATTNGETFANKELDGTAEKIINPADDKQQPQNGDIQAVQQQEQQQNGDSNIPMRAEDLNQSSLLQPIDEPIPMDLINA